MHFELNLFLRRALCGNKFDVETSNYHLVFSSFSFLASSFVCMWNYVFFSLQHVWGMPRLRQSFISVSPFLAQWSSKTTFDDEFASSTTIHRRCPTYEGTAHMHLVLLLKKSLKSRRNYVFSLISRRSHYTILGAGAINSRKKRKKYNTQQKAKFFFISTCVLLCCHLNRASETRE